MKMNEYLTALQTHLATQQSIDTDSILHPLQRPRKGGIC